ncbi:MAG: aminopeptidase [Syntrophomonadaceae bacterium]|nr:aminopeptidase [Syntrophomonadaceae bacterium]
MENKKGKGNVRAWTEITGNMVEEAISFSKGYMHFLNQAKTERESVEYIVEAAAKHGFIHMDQAEKLEPGGKLYFSYKNKVTALIVVGNQSVKNGINLVVSHLDSPRLDLKANPLYEADGLALFKTHYYGGIKKYQWLSMPLALHGVIVKKDGNTIRVNIGEREDDFVLTISDLLPHLAKDQMNKKMSEAVTGEGLNIIVGNRALNSDDEGIKQNIIRILEDRYEIDVKDFTSAELQLVPAYKAREVGFDRSMVGAYGQDDRVCAYTSLQAILEVNQPNRTAICLFVDKEEIGSVGNTGLQSLLLENLVVELLHKEGISDYYSVRHSLANSHCLSADVNAAIDPNYPEVFEKLNNSFLGNGVVLTKFTGSRGKSESNDAHPEYLGRLRKLFDDHGVVWQTGELGKVDIGGGGTVAQYVARYGAEVVDCGVAILGMHSPFEIASKADIYAAYKAYKAFMQSFIP